MFSEYLLMGILSVADTCLVNICHLYVLSDLTKWVYCQWPTHVEWISVTYMCWAILPNEYIVSGRHMSSEYLSFICVGRSNLTWYIVNGKHMSSEYLSLICVERSNLIGIFSVADTCVVNICHLYLLGDLTSWVHCQWPTHVKWISVTYMCWAILPHGYIVSDRHNFSGYLSLIWVGWFNLIGILSVADTCLVNSYHLYVLGDLTSWVYLLMGILSVADTCLVNICHLYVLRDLTSYYQWPTHV